MDITNMNMCEVPLLYDLVSLEIQFLPPIIIYHSTDTAKQYSYYSMNYRGEYNFPY